MTKYFKNENKLVDEIIATVGKKLIVGTPLGLGKGNHVLNAIYNRAKKDKTINLTILTALTLQKPQGKNLLEKNFLEPFVDRVFGDFPDFEYELDRVKGKLPKNVEVIEFYFPAGKMVSNARSQQNYMSTNYTHVSRDLLDRGANVLVQLISEGEYLGQEKLSLSSNPDVGLDVIETFQKMQSEGKKVAVIGQVNKNLPFMLGDALVDPDHFDFILKNENYNFKLFGPPKLSVSDADYMIGFHGSTLIKDEGELQIGIGSLGDSLVYSLILRHEQNELYKKIVNDFELENKFGVVIERVGEQDRFKKGLFAATEMLVDSFMYLYKSGILKRKVYDDLVIQRLLNEEQITESVNPYMLEIVLKRKGIDGQLSEKDFLYLQKFGILKGHDELYYSAGNIFLSNGENGIADYSLAEGKEFILKNCLGDQLKGGNIVHGGFFLGPAEFYQFLNELTDEERSLINMRSVSKINQLYGHEEIDRLHRKNARFVNTCLMVTLSGAVVSDGLENGAVISGVGGQYNFVSMAHALPDGRSVINVRSTRGSGKSLRSNIVWSYGHTTIPRHLKDIVISEYGIANLRGKTDEEVIMELLNIADSRFQTGLLNKAKKAGKLRKNYQIPEKFKNNFPQMVSARLKTYKDQGLFKPFPFGTDFTFEEQRIGKALKALKRKTESRSEMIKLLLSAIKYNSIPKEHMLFLERMKLNQPKNFKEKLYQRLLSMELGNV